MKEGLNLNVHGARGLFALMVFLFHVVNSGLPTFPWLEEGLPNAVLRLNEFGVELFFAVSGYVIVGTLARSRGAEEFVANRAIRIFPVLWVSIAVIVAAAMLSGISRYPFDTDYNKPLLIVLNMLALPGIFSVPLIHPAAWSLSYEFCFYLVCALFWWGYAPKGRRNAWYLLLVLVISCAVVAAHVRALPFVAGAGVALLGQRLRPFSTMPALWIAGFLGLWGWLNSAQAGGRLDEGLLFNMGFRIPLVFVAVAGLTFGFAGLVQGRGLLAAALRAPVMLWFGTVSYSLYIWHPIVMAFVKRGLLRAGVPDLAGPYSQVVFLVVALPISVLAAAVSQRLLEDRLGKRLHRELRRRTAVHVAAPAASLSEG